MNTTLSAPASPGTTYPDTYPVQFTLLAFGQYWATADTLDGLRKFAAFEDWLDSTVVIEQIAPDGRPVTTGPAPAWRNPYSSTSAMRCLASVWVVDQDRRWQASAKFIKALGADASGTAIFGIYDHQQHASAWLHCGDALGAADGFRVMCDLDADHGGDCQNGDFRWTRAHGLSAQPDLRTI